MLYGFNAFKIDGHWELNSLSLKGCCSQDNDLSNAIKQLEENEREWIETAKKYLINIPKEK